MTPLNDLQSFSSIFIGSIVSTVVGIVVKLLILVVFSSWDRK